MVVGVCRLSLRFAGNRSLKGKRQGLRRVLDRVRAKFNTAAAEVGQQDSWQRCQLGFSVVSNDGDHAQSMIDTITGFIEQLYVAEILEREVELLNYGDDEPLGEGFDSHFDDDELFERGMP